MSGLHRRHDKLMRQLLTARDERIDAQLQGAPDGQYERLSVRERSLTVAVKRVRLAIGLPDTFDPDDERARLKLGRPEPTSARGRRRLQRATPEPLWPERQRVKPVPSSPAPPVPDQAGGADVAIELIVNAARFFGRRAADDVLDHRRSLARGLVDDSTPMLSSKPLLPVPGGDPLVGSPGPLIGELVARGFDGGDSASYARAAVRGYVDEFTGSLIDGLRRERGALDRLGHPVAPEPSVDRKTRLERELAWVACAQIAAETRSTPRARKLTAQEVAAIGELGLTDRPRSRPHTPAATTAEH